MVLSKMNILIRDSLVNVNVLKALVTTSECSNTWSVYKHRDDFRLLSSHESQTGSGHDKVSWPRDQGPGELETSHE